MISTNHITFKNIKNLEANAHPWSKIKPNGKYTLAVPNSITI